MRYTAEYKELARAKLLDAGGRHAKQYGFISSGMADLAAAAGVTTGSLYKHFTGKSELFVAMLSAELQRTADLYGSVEPSNTKQIERTLKGYLSMNHVRQPESGCPLPSLTSEVARADEVVKEAFEQGVKTVHSNLSRLTDKPETAWTLIAQNVGAVMLARAMQSESLQRELLNAVQQTGLQLIRDNQVTEKLSQD